MQALFFRSRRELGGEFPLRTEPHVIHETGKGSSARYSVMVDSTSNSNLPIAKVMADVTLIVMPLPRLPEIAEMLVAMFSCGQYH